MSAVVLDNSVSAPLGSPLTANSCRLGAGGLTTTGPVNAIGNTGVGSIFTGALTLSDDAPAGAARTQASYWTTYASETGYAGLNPNQRQSFAYGDPLIVGLAVGANIQQFENGAWVQNTTTALTAPNGNAIFLNKANVQSRPLTELNGTFTMTALAQVITAAGITSGSRIRLFLLGGSIAAFAAGITAGPAITIQVGSTNANGTFTVPASGAGVPTGAFYGYEVVFG